MKALVDDLITPLIAAILGKPDFAAIKFTVNKAPFKIGDFKSRGRVHTGRRRHLLFRGRAGERNDGAHASRPSPARSYYQAVSGMPEHHPDPGAALRVLHVAGQPCLNPTWTPVTRAQNATSAPPPVCRAYIRLPAGRSY